MKAVFIRFPMTTKQKPRIYYKDGFWRVLKQSIKTKQLRDANDAALGFVIDQNNKQYEQEQAKAGKAA